MTGSSSWIQYQGDGMTPSGAHGETRGELGRYPASRRFEADDAAVRFWRVRRYTSRGDIHT